MDALWTAIYNKDVAANCWDLPPAYMLDPQGATASSSFDSELVNTKIQDWCSGHGEPDFETNTCTCDLFAYYDSICSTPCPEGSNVYPCCDPSVYGANCDQACPSIDGTGIKRKKKKKRRRK